MKQLILLKIKNGLIAGLDQLNEWAKTQPDDTYTIELPKVIVRDRTLLQSSAYWARCDFFAKNHGEYSKRGYHFIFMEMCGFGEYFTISGEIRFIPESMTAIKINQIDPLLEAQDKYNFERNDGLPPEAQTYLPSIDEFNRGIR